MRTKLFLSKPPVIEIADLDMKISILTDNQIWSWIHQSLLKNFLLRAFEFFRRFVG